MWLTFKRRNKDWKNAPAYFFEIFPDLYRYGMGYFQASRDTMERLRESIDKNPALFLEAIKFHKSQTMFILKNEKYKRFIPNDHPAEIQEWYQSKSFYVACNKNINDILFSPKLLEI